MTMKKWEYLVVSIAQGSDGTLATIGWFIKKSVSDLDVLLDDIGSYGWELVSVSGTNYIFKRELDS